MNDLDAKILVRDSRELMQSLRKEWHVRGAPGMPDNEQDAEYKKVKQDCYTVLNLKKTDINSTRELWLAATSPKEMFDELLEVRNFV